jgi:hypothetical protein
MPSLLYQIAPSSSHCLNLTFLSLVSAIGVVNTLRTFSAHGIPFQLPISSSDCPNYQVKNPDLARHQRSLHHELDERPLSGHHEGTVSVEGALTIALLAIEASDSWVSLCSLEVRSQ